MAGQIFNGNINAQATAWMMVYMLMFAVAWEAWCGWLEKRTENNKAHSEMLSKVARELMILGFIAFMVILLKEWKLLHWNPETLHVFEFCDLLVSICVLIYVGNCAISSLTMAATQRQWDRMAMKRTPEIMEQVSSYLDGFKASGCKRFMHHITQSNWRAEADFKIMQLLFESKFHLPLHFDYVEYIKLVLQNVVVSMANITTWHWVLIMAINAVWYAAIAPWSTPDGHICLFKTECDSTGPWRRRLGGATDSGDSSDAGAEDIDSYDTRMWLFVFVAIGWFVAILQGLLVININSRMKRILVYNGALSDDHVIELLESLQKKNKVSVPDQDRLDDNGAETTTLHHSNSLHHRHLVSMQAGSRAHDHEADHIMVFKNVGRHDAIHAGGHHHAHGPAAAGAVGTTKTSNDVLSIRKYEMILFISQFLQLVIDFYLGFYLVHMRMRIAIASEDSSPAQLFFHLAILLPVLLMMYLLLVTTRKIAVLFGVLHLNEDAVSHVLEHMELVKNMQRRIQDTLASTTILHPDANPIGANERLQKAERGEVAMLKLLAARPKADRIRAAEMHEMIKTHGESASLTADELDAFLGRAAFRKYELLRPAHQATAQSARTLMYTETGDAAEDSITVHEFSTFVMRYVADAIEESTAMSAAPGVVQKFKDDVAVLDSVDGAMMEKAGRLARTKELFRATDMDKSGLISRSELFAALRRVKVPITQKQYREVFRVIDPDQTHSLKLGEWVDFMMATNEGLALQTTDLVVTKQRKSGEPTGLLGSFKRTSVLQVVPESPEPPSTGPPSPRTAAQPVVVTDLGPDPERGHGFG